MLLVAGGNADPNLTDLLRRATTRGVPHRAVLNGAGPGHRLDWDLDADTLRIDGAPIVPTALFLRYDVFAQLADGRAATRNQAGRWYTALLAWGLAHPRVAMLNRGYGTRQSSKPAVLLAAREHGLAIPATRVATDFAGAAGDAQDWIVKPVNGGEHTRLLGEIARDGGAPVPTILQRRLIGPELRLYRVGPRWFGFLLRSPLLDYRADPKVEVAAVAAPPDLTGPLGALMDALGLDFGAADFKTCPDTGRHLFLEVNSAPMFAGFDRVARGTLADAILDRLGPRPATAAACDARPSPCEARPTRGAAPSAA